MNSVEAACAGERGISAAEPPAIPGVPSSVTVGQLISRAAAAISQAFPATVFLRGVISSVKSMPQGWVFVDVAEEQRQEQSVSCVIWRDAPKITKKLTEAGFKLEKDLQVMFEVRVSLTGKRGASLSLEIVSIVAEYTVGKLAAQREVTNERLRKEGLFEKNRAVPFHFLPQRLGLLTSAGGTVINDFMASLEVSRFGFELFWHHVRVQGSDAKRDLLGGIAALTALNVDAILIFRGGGSAADLAVFNDYEVARAVCTCPLPVIAAIGHQEDQSSVQDVSWRAFGVPKDIGRFFADLVLERRRQLAEFSRRIADSGMSMIERLTERLQRTGVSLVTSSQHTAELRAGACARLINEFPIRGRFLVTQASDRTAVLGARVRNGVEQTLALIEQRLQAAAALPAVAEQSLERKEKELHFVERLVQGASPEVQLSRGFALVKRVADGSVLTSAAQLTTGDSVEVQFADASRKARIEG